MTTADQTYRYYEVTFRNGQQTVVERKPGETMPKCLERVLGIGSNGASQVSNVELMD